MVSKGGELMASNGKVTHSAADGLFWSRRGHVACRDHAPDMHSKRWQIDGWCSIPESANGRHGLAYQCPHCAPSGRPHRHISEMEPDTQSA
jgi:hypothetical protein